MIPDAPSYTTLYYCSSQTSWRSYLYSLLLLFLFSLPFTSMHSRLFSIQVNLMGENTCSHNAYNSTRYFQFLIFLCLKALLIWLLWHSTFQILLLAHGFLLASKILIGLPQDAVLGSFLYFLSILSLSNLSFRPMAWIRIYIPKTLKHSILYHRSWSHDSRSVWITATNSTTQDKTHDLSIPSHMKTK